ncbi:hypothetical protein CDD80_2508 [Ophiocordyceps camponoti-rufipedis]|uniref:Glycoside hydrolase family 5 domain-containing protein n=1 Tax=Ophiocordyceps camponoti-rufipedis TaxID=2004952 RepID=A0A2C5Z6B8_9HYPO|nr:hypothetical protein CDD80_2508 [Ophiocordyceps camponoti-rufipedis]
MAPRKGSPPATPPLKDLKQDPLESFLAWQPPLKDALPTGSSPPPSPLSSPPRPPLPPLPPPLPQPPQPPKQQPPGRHWTAPPLRIINYGTWVKVRGYRQLPLFQRPRSKRVRTLQRLRRWQLSPCRMILIILAIFLLAIVGYIWRKEARLSAPWIPDAESKLFSKGPLPPPRQSSNISQFQLPLKTRGRAIVDQTGRRFKLSSVNWYGASDELFVVGGLEVQHRDVIAQTILRLGFNSVRLPYSDELVMKNPVIESRLVSANPDLAGKRALDVLEAAVTALTEAGIAVIVNNHITTATWCCGIDPCDSGWANDHLGLLCRVAQTEEQWIHHWEKLMARFVDNPRVIGADLRNEVRGLWGTMPWSRWASAAERCGNRLLSMRPDWLIFVEGTESANDVSGARDRPIRLDVADRLVYSAHVYAWSGWGSWQGRFAQRDYDSFAETMRRNWAYLVDGDVAPVWVGELGAPNNPTNGDAHYWKNLWRFLKDVDADFGYWAINPRKPKDNGSESYSIVADDWVTPVLDYRLKDMVDLMHAS